MAEQTVTLQPGESKVVSFEATPTVAKIYQVSVNGLSGSFVAISAIPEVVIDFPDLAIWDVEGIPFISVGEEVIEEINWDIFASNFKSADWWPTYISDVDAIIECIRNSGLSTIADLRNSGGAVLMQCGINHPEWLTAYANSHRTGETVNNVPDFISRFGVEPYVCLRTQGIGLDIHVYKLGWIPDAGDCAWFTYTYLESEWELVGRNNGFQSIIDTVLSYPTPLEPFIGLVATLAEPIEMSELRGVILTWLNKTIPTYADCGTIWVLRYKPTFSAEMPPPSFGLISLDNPAAGETKAAPITGCYAGGYYYPGIYDGIVTVEAGCGYHDGTFTTYAGGGRFMIKNLVRITGEGVIQ